MSFLIRRILIGIGLVALQWLVFGRLRIWEVYPDAVLLYVIVIALQSGRLAGSIAGFFLGLAMDVIYGTWGIQMFAKTLIGFLVGLFPIDERGTLNVSAQQAFLGTLVTALLHNGLVVIFYALTAGTRTPFLIFGLWIGSALYTAFLALIAALFWTR